MALPVGTRFELPDEHLKALGQTVIEWSHLEHVVEEVIWDLYKLSYFDEGAGPALTKHIPFEVRLDIVSSTLEVREVPQKVKDDWKELRRGLDEPRKWRNKLVHGGWSSLSKNSIPMLSSTTARKSGPKTQNYEAKLEDIEYVSTAIKEIRVKIRNWQDALPWSARR